MKEAVTHPELVQHGARYLRDEGRCCVLAEPSLISGGESPDVISWTVGGVCTVIECKASLSDLRADESKPWRVDPSQGLGDFRYYLFERGAIEEYHVPEDSRWGVLLYNPFTEQVRVERAAIRHYRMNYHHQQALLLQAIKHQTSGRGKSKRSGGGPTPKLNNKQRELITGLVVGEDELSCAAAACAVGASAARVSHDARAGLVKGVEAFDRFGKTYLKEADNG